MRRPGVIAAVVGSAALLAAALIGLSLAGRESAAPPVRTGETPSQLLGVSEARTLLRGIPQDGIALGWPKAPVTLVEFADLQCPYCARWARDAFPTIVDEYVRPGRVRLVFRGLAFVGPESDTALRATLAAGEQDRLWNVVHVLYANQGPENAGWVTNDLLRGVGGSCPPRRRPLADRLPRHRGRAGAGGGRQCCHGSRAFAVRRSSSRAAPAARSSPSRSTRSARTAMRAHLDALLAG